MPGPTRLHNLRAELLAAPALTECILETLPPPPPQQERVIRCSLANVTRAICRAVALTSERGEFWRIEPEADPCNNERP
jgi:hypothetical protein